MKKENLFIILLVTMILITRAFLFFLPAGSVLWIDKLKHIQYGIIILVFFLFYNKFLKKKIVLPFAIAFAWIIDEIVYVLFSSNYLLTGYIVKEQYFSILPVSFVVVMSLLAIIFRKGFLSFINKFLT